MSVWDEDDEDIDFMDPTAPLGADESDDAPAGREDDPLPSDLPGDGTPSPGGVCRVWVDDDGHLQQVRISNRWRERVKDQPLGDFVHAALSAARSMHVTGAAATPPPSIGLERGAKPAQVSGAAIDRLVEESLSMIEESDALSARGDEPGMKSTWTGSPVEGFSVNRKVCVVLDMAGGNESVRMDEDWLKTAQVAQICDAVVEAQQHAESLHEPPVLEVGEHGKMAERAGKLRLETLGLLAADR